MRMCKGGEKLGGVLWEEGAAAREERSSRRWKHPLTAHSEHLVPRRGWLEASQIPQ